MTIGDKIKKARIEQGKTQKELAGDKITRNMLSAIESNKAFPSVDTAKYLANCLSIPFAYLMADDDKLFSYKKNEVISAIKADYVEKRYLSCINQIKALKDTDDELSYILAECYYHLGRDAVMNGSLSTGEKFIDEALKSAEKTIYNTSHIEAGSIIYKAIASNIQAPLLELKTDEYEKIILNTTDIELYKYVIQDADYKFNNQIFSMHQQARNLIRNREFNDALKILCRIEEERSKEKYNAFVVFSIYTDIERCYREIRDYENAYRYANKRLSLLEAFKQ